MIVKQNFVVWGLKLNFSHELSKIILVLAMACLVSTFLSTSISWIEPTDWGLVNRLPLVYYAGLFLLGFLWYTGFKSKFYLPAAFVLTLAYVYVAPAIIRIPVWTSNSYYPFGESLMINSAGRLVDTPPTIGNYHYWPLFLFFSSAFTNVSGLPHYALLKLFPLLAVSMYGILAFLILRIKLALPYAYLGAGWVLASLFVRQQYFGPQSIAYIFFLAILLVVTLLFFGNVDDRNRKALGALLAILFVVTTFTHALTSFMSLLIIYAAYFTHMLKKKRRAASLGVLSLTATVIWVGYNSLSAVTFFKEGVEHFTQIFTGSREISLYAQGSRIIGSTAQQINFGTSWAIVGVGCFIALLSIIHLLRNIKIKRQVDTYSIFTAALLIMISLFAFVGEYGPQESFTRAFMFGLVPLSFLCVSFMARKPKLIVAILTVLIFLNIPAQYGSDAYRLATNTQLDGTAFIAHHAPDAIKIVGEFTLYIKYHNPMKNYTILSIGLTTPFTEIPNSTVITEGLYTADYVIISDLQHNYFIFYLGMDPLEQINLQDFSNMVYDNGGFSLSMPFNSSEKWDESI